MKEQERRREKKLEIMMKDYELLKTYSTISSPKIRYNIVSFALATISIFFSGVMIALSSVSISPLVIKVVIILTFFLLPLFCITVLFIWLGEELRMMRTGKYCQELEKKINKEYKEEILGSETSKREKSIKFPEILVIALFFGSGLGSSIVSLFIAKSALDYYFPLGKYSIVTVLALYLFVFIMVIVVSKKRILKLEQNIPN